MKTIALILLLAVIAVPLIAQTAEERARIDYEEAKLIALAAQIKVAAPALEAKEKGYWNDSDTGLMWTVKDNGDAVDWNQATEYCRTLTLGGFGGWRLPRIEELTRIYDANSEKQYKTRGPIEISDFFIWSSTMAGSSEAWALSFYDGQRGSYPLGYSHGNRALCVRPSE